MEIIIVYSYFDSNINDYQDKWVVVSFFIFIYFSVYYTWGATAVSTDQHSDKRFCISVFCLVFAHNQLFSGLFFLSFFIIVIFWGGASWKHYLTGKPLHADQMRRRGTRWGSVMLPRPFILRCSGIERATKYIYRRVSEERSVYKLTKGTFLVDAITK